MNTLTSCYVAWHMTRVFFEDFTAWKKLSAAAEITNDLSADWYDQLFKGTNANIYVPLWASACIGNEDILLNETTLDIIRFYKKYGYRWTDMDGNPPDYIGQQCRFLEYLAACTLNGEALTSAMDGFIDRFFTDTVHRMAAALMQVTQSTEIRAMLDLLFCTISPDREFPTLPGPEITEYFDSRAWTLLPELPVEPERITTHASFCDCGNKCKMLARVQEGCVLSVFPDSSIPEKRFTGCARGRAYRQTFLSSRRLRYPMERVGQRGSGLFRRISWEEAAEKVSCGIRKAGETYGPGSRYVTAASGVSALVRGDRFVKHLLSINGGYLQYYNTYSTGCANYVLPYIYGTNVCGSVEEDLFNTKLLILWGHNPADTQWGDRQLKILAELKQKGLRIIVIDPRRTETAHLMADQWIGLRPGTDGALADAMAYVIWSEGLQDQTFMDTFCLGFDEQHMPAGYPAHESYHSYLFGHKDGLIKTPQWAEEITGVPAQVIINLAREYASTKPACLIPGLGPQRTMNGEQNCRSCAMLACLTGNVGISGGSSGAYASRKGHSAPQFIPRESPYRGEIPTFLWTRAIDDPQSLTPAEGLRGVEKLDSGIKVIFNLASGILMNQHSNINDTIRILREPGKLDFLVVSDVVMTPSARFADLLLPGVSFFETENVVPPWSDSDYLLYNEQAIPPLFGSLFEFEWVRLAARHMGYEEQFLLG